MSIVADSTSRARCRQETNFAPAGNDSPSIPDMQLDTPISEFVHAVKEYPVGLLGRRKLRAVDDVSLALRRGEVLALIGPNRAGKTTLVKLLLSLCRPTSGEIRRLGLPGADRRTLARVGYVHENHAFPRYLTAAALLEYYGALSLLPHEELKERVPALLQRVGLADRAHDTIARFSKGMLQRLGVAQALINDPDLLVLDEPSEGLDLDGRQMIHDIAAELRGKGRTVLLVSHVLGEVEKICDRVAVLVAGKLRYVGDTANLTKHPQTGAARSLEEAVREYYENPCSNQ